MSAGALHVTVGVFLTTSVRLVEALSLGEAEAFTVKPYEPVGVDAVVPTDKLELGVVVSTVPGLNEVVTPDGVPAVKVMLSNAGSDPLPFQATVTGKVALPAGVMGFGDCEPSVTV